jgi:outer membrane protein assembly factor BamB
MSVGPLPRVGAVLLSGAVASGAGAADWLQFGGDAAHSGYNAAEHGYSTAAGNQLAFAPVTLPAAVDAAPVYVSHVASEDGSRNLLLAVARDGTLLALDADRGVLLWSAHAPGLGTLTTGAPAVDAAHAFVYAYGMDGKVHKYNLVDGEEESDDRWPQTVTLKPDIDKNASALTIATAANGHTYLYAVSNSYFDSGDFQGHLTAIDLASGVQNVFNAQCSDLNMHFVANGVTSGSAQNDCAVIPSPRPGQTAGSGIWGRPGAVYDARTDRVYITTGNGLFDPLNAQGNGRDWGDSVLALNADGSGSFLAGLPVDSYTPATHPMLLANDADLGSTSPVILPAPAGSAVAHLAMQGGKDGCVRLLDLDDMSGAATPGHVGGELQAINLPGTVNHCADGGNLGQFRAQAAVWVNPADASTWTFVGHTTGFVAYRVVLDDAGAPTLAAMWSSTDAGTSPVVANGTVYYANSGVLRALDAVSGTPLWSDTQIGAIHWQSPVVVNGRLYVFDAAAKLWAYQLDGIQRGTFD